MGRANAICDTRMRYAIREYATGRANAICDTRIGYALRAIVKWLSRPYCIRSSGDISNQPVDRIRRSLQSDESKHIISVWKSLQALMEVFSTCTKQFIEHNGNIHNKDSCHSQSGVQQIHHAPSQKSPQLQLLRFQFGIALIPCCSCSHFLHQACFKAISFYVIRQCGSIMALTHWMLVFFNRR